MKKVLTMALPLVRLATVLALSAIVPSVVPRAAQQGQTAPPRNPTGGGRSTGIEPLAMDERVGFESIFDGKTLKGWDGDPQFWRVEDGAIIGESTPEKPVKVNTFLIWRGGQPKDFELKLEYRISATNSGIQYRSVELPDVGKWVLKGYQADIDFQNQYTGQVYEERGRGFLALRGQLTTLQAGKKRVMANLSSSDDLKSLIKPDWNQVHIIARGNVLTHIFNGHLMAQAIDDDAANRMMSGLLGLQMHMGAPMKLECRNILLKNL